MNCYTHKNLSATGVCSRCGGGVCQVCAETFPALCPVCKIAAAKKAVKRIRQNNRIILYLGLFFSALLFVVSFIIYLNKENYLWFLLNAPSLLFVAVFILILLKNKKRKKAQYELITRAQELKALSAAPDSPPALTKSDVSEIVENALKDALKQLKTAVKAEPVPVLKEEPVTKTEKPEPKTTLKPKESDKTNPFVTENKTVKEPAASKPSKKSAKKVWICECGNENPTSKLFCMECGLKRTKEMLQNAKEI